MTSSSTYSLGKVRDALDFRFPNTGVRVNCPAVCCPFGWLATEQTEVIPADQMRDSNGYQVYDIANGAGGWMKTSPDAHNAYVKAVDDKLSGKVKPLIRFIKAWKYFRDVPISSFYLELRVAKYASGENAIVYEIDVKNILKLLWDSQLASMQDAVGVPAISRPAPPTSASKRPSPGWRRRSFALKKLVMRLTRRNSPKPSTLEPALGRLR